MAEQLPFDLGHLKTYGREDFWVSSSNAEAIAWIDKWPDWPAPLLIIYGPKGCGKTHLLNLWLKEAETKRPGKAVIIDDIDLQTGDRVAEQKLFHLYNQMKEEGGFILAAAQTPPQEWPLALPDLKSRLMASPAVAIGLPDDQLGAVLLTKLFSDRQIFVSQDVVSYILSHSGRSYDALQTLVTAIDRKAMAEKRAVTIPLVRDVMAG